MSTSIALRPINPPRPKHKRQPGASKQRYRRIWYRNVHHATVMAQQHHRLYDICRAEYDDQERRLRLFSSDGQIVLEYKPGYATDEGGSPLIVTSILVEFDFFETTEEGSGKIARHFSKFHIRKLAKPAPGSAKVAINDSKKKAQHKKKSTP